MNFQSIAYLLSGSEHIHWIWALKLRSTQYGFCGLGGLPKCKDNSLFLGWAGQLEFFGRVQKKFFLGLRVVRPGPYPIEGPLPQETRWGCCNVQLSYLKGQLHKIVLLLWVEISMGHTAFLGKVVLMWVIRPRVFPKSS